MNYKHYPIVALLLLVPVFAGFSTRTKFSSPPRFELPPPQKVMALPAPDPARLRLRSQSAMVVDRETSQVLFTKNPDEIRPIASITKLMTAMVVLDAHLPMDQKIKVTEDDVDRIRWSTSRLPVGWTLSRHDLLQLALMASENRAAYALSRAYPGGREAFIDAMNRKAWYLGLDHTYFAGPTGLDGRNVSTAQDLVKLVDAALKYPTIREMTTTGRYRVRSSVSGRERIFGNSNRLIHNHHWKIGLSKTGYILEAGHCLVMEAAIDRRPVIFILLDSQGKYSRIGDALRIRRWMRS